MRQNIKTWGTSSEKTVIDTRRATRKQYSAEEKIRIVLGGLRGEESIAELCRHEGIAQSLYYSWSKEFLEAGKKRLAVPGMPTGSPGMEMPGFSPDSYEVILFDDKQSQVFSRY